MRSWEMDLLRDAFQILLGILGIASLWVTVFPHLFVPNLAVWMRRKVGLSASLFYRGTRVGALVYWLLLLPYGGLLAIELLFGGMTKSRWVRDWLHSNGFSISYFADQLDYPAFRVWALVTLVVVIPALILWIARGKANKEWFFKQLRIVDGRNGEFRCLHCGYDRGSNASPESACPECGRPWLIERSRRIRRRERFKGAANSQATTPNQTSCPNQTN